MPPHIPNAIFALVAANLFSGGGGRGGGGLVMLAAGATICSDGQYLDGTTCMSCGPGTYLNASKGTSVWPSVCDLCPGGEFVATSGADRCYECLPGEYSVADRTQCASCEAGQFVANGTACQACPGGTYAPQALNGACLDCGAGSYTLKKVRGAAPTH
jgi:hypothetical protein